MTTVKKENTSSLNIKPATRNRGLNYLAVFEEFVFWFALNRIDRKNLGIESQRDFAAYHKVSERTLSVWSDRPEFMPAVRKLWKKWGKARTPSVVAAIYQSSVSGGKEAPQAQKLWMQVFEDFSEKTENKNTNTEKVEIGEKDIRFIIDGLPEPMRTKFNGYITEIIVESNKVKNARTVDDIGWDDQRPEETVLNETDIITQDIPDERADEVATSDIQCVPKDMVTDTNGATHTSENNNQGA